MSKIKVALGFAATFTALTALSSAASARDLTGMTISPQGLIARG